MEFVEYQNKGRIIEIILNRPEKRNSFSPQLVSELKEAFQKAREDESGKVIVLKANGTVFSAGADLGYLQSLQNNSYEENLADSEHLKSLFEMIYFHKKIVIAQVEGSAIAGGCGLTTVCDFVFSVPEAQFGYTEVKIGFIPAIVSFFLLRKTNESIAKKLLLTGDLFSTQKAFEYGLVSQIFEKEEISVKVGEFANQLIENCSTSSLEITKQMIANIQTMNTKDALQYAAEQNAHARATEDCKKGISSFLNKEKLIW